MRNDLPAGATSDLFEGAELTEVCDLMRCSVHLWMVVRHFWLCGGLSLSEGVNDLNISKFVCVFEYSVRCADDGERIF